MTSRQIAREANTAELETKGKREADFAKKLKPTDAAIDKKKEETGQKQREDYEKETKTNLDQKSKVIRELEQTENRLKEELRDAEKAESNVTEDERAIMRSKITATQDRIRDEKEGINELKKINKEASEATKEGQKEIDQIFKDRVEAYAKTFENENVFWRGFKNVIKFPTGSPTSKSDNTEIARAIRKSSKSKTSDQLAKEALKQERKEKKERGEPVDEDEDEATPPPLPTPNPPPPPTGGTTT